MATNQVRTVTIEESLLPHPPELKSLQTGFQYRGRLFRPFSATNRQTETGERAAASNINSVCKPPRAQSAKGRLEKQLSSSSSLSSENQDKRLHSVVNLDLLSDIHSVSFMTSSNKLKKDSHSSKNGLKKALMKEFSNPDFSCLMDSKNSIQPSVQGVKVLQKGKEEKTIMHEVWINSTYKPEPDTCIRKDHEQQETENIFNTQTNEKKLPSTLSRLKPWLRNSTSVDVIGLEPSKCCIFLSHDYEIDDIPELPVAQTVDQDLAYTCIVETPIKLVKKRYSHPVINAKPSKAESDLNQNKKERRNSDISFIRNVLSEKGVQNIVEEIKELEDLMKGIGSKNSKCSFVRFQDEILKAKILASKLIKIKKDEYKPSEEIDTFGLLQLYREHEEIMKILVARRDFCLQELSRLCNGWKST
ncbi:hypothetical protein Btru_013365 [Bulinus truncatus]|nr:hypothetical protein Btru_013365 [Bulinus truncatus]